MGRPFSERGIAACAIRLAAAGMSVYLMSCAASPVLDAAMSIGRSLLTTTAQNYASSYSDDVHLLLNALWDVKQVPKPSEKDATASTSTTTTEPDDSSWGLDDWGIADDGNAAPEKKKQGEGAEQKAGADDWGIGDWGTEAPSNPTSPAPSPQTAPVAIQLEAAIMKEVQIDGKFLPVPIQDGDTLRDGGGVEGAGDNLKILFRTNTACYVYVISVDATGWVTTLFPEDGRFDTGNPVTPFRQHMIPGGNVWYYLDQTRGKETTYFVAAHERRADLEEALRKLSRHRRPDFPSSAPPARVQQVAVIQGLRGIQGKRMGHATLVPTSSGTREQVVPDQFYAQLAGADLVVTRWFHHLGP